MEFMRPSYFNTSTMIAVNSNTLTAENLLRRDPLYQYYSDGMNSDSTTTVITITFDQTMPVSRLAMLDMNFKEFSVFYNGVTANTFALTNADTAASSYTGNTDENKFFRFNTVQCSSITINAKKTITADQEKRIGLFVPTDLLFALELTPSADGFRNVLVPKQTVHKLSDGGTRIHTVRKKWDSSLSLDYLSESQRDDLYANVYNLGTEFNFCPFGTATGWNAQFFECIWDGPFQFYEFSDNAVSSGYSGKISLKETPS